jgi:UDP-N-acetylmuramyl pentapeptide phosphotransferase/UDP-N-acetylglucosamine-1-phosphate transferase
VAIVAGIAIGVGVLSGEPDAFGGVWMYWLCASTLLVASISYLDDRGHVRAGYRLAVHIAAACAIPIAGIALKVLEMPGYTYHLPVWLSWTFVVVFTVWMINLYNFMDGMDGFAGGMAMFGFGALAVIGWAAEYTEYAVINAIIFGSACGFLIFNFPPSRIFMGDTGSSTLGFLAAGMSLWGDAIGVVPLWISVLVFSPFTVDATITLARRAWRKERVWLAHKTHYYQRLVLSGWGHRKTVLVEYSLMLVCAGSAIAARFSNQTLQWALIALVIAAHTAFILLVRESEKRAKYRILRGSEGGRAHAGNP